ncbi:unnamed protein product, partial [Acanthoscelides obtectus]
IYFISVTGASKSYICNFVHSLYSDLICASNYSVVGLSETWLDISVDADTFKLPGYNLSYKTQETLQYYRNLRNLLNFSIQPEKKAFSQSKSKLSSKEFWSAEDIERVLIERITLSINLAYVELASDASRLLLDFYHKYSVIRRDLLILNLRKDLKETLTNVSADGWLFGKDLGERIKATKDIEKSGLDLKPTRVSRPSTSFKQPAKQVPENFHRPPRRTQRGNIRGGRPIKIPNPSQSFQKRPHQTQRRTSDQDRRRRQDVHLHFLLYNFDGTIHIGVPPPVKSFRSEDALIMYPCKWTTSISSLVNQCSVRHSTSMSSSTRKASNSSIFLLRDLTFICRIFTSCCLGFPLPYFGAAGSENGLLGCPLATDPDINIYQCHHEEQKFFTLSLVTSGARPDKNKDDTLDAGLRLHIFTLEPLKGSGRLDLSTGISSSKAYIQENAQDPFITLYFHIITSLISTTIRDPASESHLLNRFLAPATCRSPAVNTCANADEHGLKGSEGRSSTLDTWAAQAAALLRLRCRRGNNSHTPSPELVVAV